MQIRALLLLFALVGAANAQPVCDVTPEKRQLITSLLCGQHAPEDAYRQYGPGCFKRSVERRLEDSVLQVYLYELCGEGQFANEMRDATIKAMQFMEMFSSCVDEIVNIEEIYEDRDRYVRNRAKSLTCTPDRRSLVKSRRSFFEAQVAQSKDVNLVPTILNRLSIRVDGDGNLFDN